MKNDIIYKLIEEDVQFVSEETLGRRLNPTEISEIKNIIAERINWFETIECVIYEIIKENHGSV